MEIPKEPDIFTQDYWRQRLQQADDRDEPHKSVYSVGIDKWEPIVECHRRLLAEHIHPEDWILDVACGWGRLLELLPESPARGYHGVDISEAFIQRARQKFPNRYFHFEVHDLRHELPYTKAMLRAFKRKPYQWGIVCGTRPMIIGQAGQAEWDKIEANVSKLVDKLMFLEYDIDNLIEIKQL